MKPAAIIMTAIIGILVVFTAGLFLLSAGSQSTTSHSRPPVVTSVSTVSVSSSHSTSADFSFPAGLTKSAVEEKYAATLALIRTSLESGDYAPLQADAAALAIFTDTNTKENDIYRRNDDVERGGLTVIMNGVGYVTKKDTSDGERYVLYVMKVKDVDYTIVLEDTAGFFGTSLPEVEE